MSRNRWPLDIKDPEDEFVMWFAYFNGHGYFMGFGATWLGSDQEVGYDHISASRERCTALGLFEAQMDHIRSVSKSWNEPLSQPSPLPLCCLKKIKPRKEQPS